MTHLLAKQRKLVTNGELTKLWLMAAAKEMCPEKTNLTSLAFQWEKLLRELKTLETTSFVN